jgi:hypothetical protein
MTQDMLSLCKKVLLRVSSNKKLFARELRKSIRHLTGEDLKHLKTWCTERFRQHAELIESAFRPYPAL